jgi:2-oxoisovalerate dehydrogenase E1 component alpha subunit
MSGPGAASDLTDARILEMYRTAVVARTIDERMGTLVRAGRFPFTISGQGHECAQVAIVGALTPGFDWLLPYYRSLAAVLSFGVTAREVALAHYARAADPASGGRQMPGHHGHAGRNILSVSSPVATQILHAAGIALAAKLRGTGQVAMTFMGDGSSNQGDVHEGLNFAAIHRLPMILVIENNGLAISVPSEKGLAVPDVAARASGYGIPGVVVGGTDVRGAYRAAREAVDRARAGAGPTLIEAKVLRLTSHTSDDQETRYRPAGVIAAEHARDPLPIFRAALRADGILTPEEDARIRTEAREIVEDATDFAEAAPDPDPSTAMSHVYAEPPAEVRPGPEGGA